MQELLEMERFVSNSMARIITVSADLVDREIAVLMGQMLATCGFDRCGLMMLTQDKTEARASHACHGEGISAVPETYTLRELFPWTGENLLYGNIVTFSSLAELPPQAETDRRNYAALGVQSYLAIPIYAGGSVEFFIDAHQVRARRIWSKESISLLRLFGEVCANALAGGQTRNEEVRLQFVRFVSDLSVNQNEQIIGQSAALDKVLRLVEQVAATDSTVLICGETGTGKELVARAIQELSLRRNKPMVKVNCASLPAALVESELFGREKGAYTGALTRQAGRFEVADGATIFLDEISEMSPELQAKLLRVLQEGQFERLGSTKTIHVDVRVIAATNRNLADEVKKGTFREDLYYRLNVFQIVVPPLRERAEDIPLLAWAFVNEFNEKMGKKINRIAKLDMIALQNYHWPGNVRELRNVIEYGVIVSTGNGLHVRLPEGSGEEPARPLLMDEVERQHITRVLQRTGWRIKGENGAARILGMNPSTLYSRMQKLGIAVRNGQDEISP